MRSGRVLLQYRNWTVLLTFLVVSTAACSLEGCTCVASEGAFVTYAARLIPAIGACQRIQRLTMGTLDLVQESLARISQAGQLSRGPRSGAEEQTAHLTHATPRQSDRTEKNVRPARPLGRLVIESLLWLVGATLLRDARRRSGAARGHEAALLRKQEAARAEQELALIYRYAPVALYTFDLEGRILRASQSAARMAGCNPEEMIGRTLAEVAPDLAGALQEIIAAVTARKAPELAREVHGPLPAQPDEVREWVSSFYPILDEQGEVVAVSGVSLEMTEHNRALVALAESEATFSTLVDSGNDWIFSVDSERFALLTFNRPMREHFAERVGITLRTGMLPEELGPPERAAQWRAWYLRAREEGQLAVEYTTLQGARVLEIRIHSLRRDGRMFGLGVFAHDVTTERAAQRVLREAREQLEQQVAGRTQELSRAYETLKAVLESAPVAVWIAHDPRCEVITGNASANLLFGEVADGTNVSHGQPRHLSAVHYTVFRDGLELTTDELPNQLAARTGRVVPNAEYELRFEGGRHVHLVMAAAPLFGADGAVRGSVAVATDVTSLRHTEAALRVSEARYRKIVETAQEGILVVDAHDVITYANPQLAHMFGCAVEALVGRSALDLTFPEDRASAQARWRQRREGAVEHALEARYRRFDGEELWALISATPLYHDDGALFGALVVMSDIRERKRADEERMRLVADLARSNARLKELDHLKTLFIASMSHELRTPLNSILGFTGIILQGMVGPLNPEQHKQLSMVKASGERLLSLITDVIDISKIEAGILARSEMPFSMSALVEDVVSDMRASAEAKGLSLDLSTEEACSIVSDARRVRQIVVGLLDNAIKFTDRGAIALTVRHAESGVELVVRDTGIGIPAESLGTLFQPFVQIRKVGRATEGAGLGLHLAAKLAALLGGHLEAESEVGAWSVFRLWLPREPAEGPPFSG